MLGVEATVTVAFEPAGADRPQRMRVTIDGEEPISSRAYTPATPNREALVAFAGSYRAAELLDAAFDLRVEEGALVLHTPDRREVPLTPVSTALFHVPGFGVAVRFQRDEDAAVTGFLVDAGRVRGIAFSRTPE